MIDARFYWNWHIIAKRHNTKNRRETRGHPKKSIRVETLGEMVIYRMKNKVTGNKSRGNQNSLLGYLRPCNQANPGDQRS